MDIQLLVVLLVFSTALFFLGRRFYLQFTKKHGAGCEKCGIADSVSNVKDSGK